MNCDLLEIEIYFSIVRLKKKTFIILLKLIYLGPSDNYVSKQ